MLCVASSITDLFCTQKFDRHPPELWWSAGALSIFEQVQILGNKSSESSSDWKFTKILSVSANRLEQQEATRPERIQELPYQRFVKEMYVDDCSR